MATDSIAAHPARGAGKVIHQSPSREGHHLRALSAIGGATPKRPGPRRSPRAASPGAATPAHRLWRPGPQRVQKMGDSRWAGQVPQVERRPRLEEARGERVPPPLAVQCELRGLRSGCAERANRRRTSQTRWPSRSGPGREATADVVSLRCPAAQRVTPTPRGRHRREGEPLTQPGRGSARTSHHRAQLAAEPEQLGKLGPSYTIRQPSSSRTLE